MTVTATPKGAPPVNVLLIRDLARDAAQDAFHRLVKAHLATGQWDRRLLAEYHTAEAILDLAEERIRDMADSFDPGDGHSVDPLPDIPLAVDHYPGPSVELVTPEENLRRGRPLTPDPGDWFVRPTGTAS